MTENVILKHLAEVVRREVKAEDIQGDIRRVSTRGMAREKDTILEGLRRDGVVDRLVANLAAKLSVNSAHNFNVNFGGVPLSAPGPGQYLSICITNGSKFADHLLVDHTNVNDRFEYSLTDPHGLRMAFQFVLAYQRQRFNSVLIPCVKDPVVEQQFYIKITDGDYDNTSVSSLLELREPIHLLLIKRDLMTQERWLISSQVIEWRMVLCNQSWSSRLNIDLQGVFDECKINVGSIEVVLQLVPEKHRELSIQQEDFNDQLRAENLTYGSDKDRKFISYAKSWWQEFKNEHDFKDGCERRVKIFAQDENCLNRFVCDYLSPIRAGRVLDSPAQAARFVSSIPVQSHSSIGHNSSNHELWKSGLAFLVENRGNTENHALLLCSLLLGYGLNAYVAVGVVKDDSVARRPHTWVITFQEEHPNEAKFWEACTGKKYHFHSFPHYVPPVNLKFEYFNIGCIFNHFQFFANNHKNDSVEMTVFTLNNAGRWKPMSEEVISTIVDNRYFEKSISNSDGNISWSNRIPLFISRLVPFSEDTIKISNDLENQLRTVLTSFRCSTLGSNNVTKWDDQLCYILGQALFSYEQEQLTGVSNVGNDEFKDAVQRHVLEGYTFKAFPLHVLHTNAKLILETALKSPVFQEIVHCRGSDIKFALRVRTFGYAEQSTPTWVIFGCTYQFSL